MNLQLSLSDAGHLSGSTASRNTATYSMRSILSFSCLPSHESLKSVHLNRQLRKHKTESFVKEHVEVFKATPHRWPHNRHCIALQSLSGISRRCCHQGFISHQNGRQYFPTTASKALAHTNRQDTPVESHHSPYHELWQFGDAPKWETFLLNGRYYYDAKLESGDNGEFDQSLLRYVMSHRVHGDTLVSLKLSLLDLPPAHVHLKELLSAQLLTTLLLPSSTIWKLADRTPKYWTFWLPFESNLHMSCRRLLLQIVNASESIRRVKVSRFNCLIPRFSTEILLVSAPLSDGD